MISIGTDAGIFTSITTYIFKLPLTRFQQLVKLFLGRDTILFCIFIRMIYDIFTVNRKTYELVERLRREVPGIHIRTTLMVGFPGETEEDFEELKAFVKWARFERMGAFAYSEEEGTYSEQHYEDDVPENVKQRRLDQLMRIQQHISAELEAEKVGKTFRVIIDRREGAYYVGRTEFCSPEVDPEVLIPVSERSLTIGEFYDVSMTDSEEFDLYGTTINL